MRNDPPCPDCGRRNGHRMRCPRLPAWADRVGREAVGDDPHPELDLHPTDEARPEWTPKHRKEDA